MSAGESTDGESTDPEIMISVVEGLTDRAAFAPARSEETQIARPPERSSTPGTEIVHAVAPARPESGADPAETSESVHIQTRPASGAVAARTSSTEIVTPLKLAGSDPDDLPDLPRTQSTGETSWNPEVYRRRRLIYTTSTAALVLIIVASLYQLHGLGEVDEDLPPTIDAPGAAQVPEAASDPSLSEEEKQQLEESKRGKKTPRLLALKLDEILPDGRISAVKVDDTAIEASAVTIVNLWATWCEPCKQELPGFGELLARNAWGDDVRFTPILIDDKDPVWAHSKFASLMPAGSRFFVDPRQGAVVDALREHKLLPPDSGLPVTLVYDCKQRARVIYTQLLSAADLLKLEEIVQNLRGELKSSYCKKPRPSTSVQTREPPAPVLPPPQKPQKPSPSRCGNGVCELGESPDDCCDCRCACLRCPEGKRCESPNGVAICVDSVLRLKD